MCVCTCVCVCVCVCVCGVCVSMCVCVYLRKYVCLCGFLCESSRISNFSCNLPRKIRNMLIYVVIFVILFVESHWYWR